MRRARVRWSECCARTLLIFAAYIIQRSLAQCAAGQYSADGTTDCKQCAMGTFQDQTAQTSCKACDNGKYQDLLGQASCKHGDGCTKTQRINSLATGCETCALKLMINSPSIKVCLDCTSHSGACEKTNCDGSGVVCFDDFALDMSFTRSWNFDFDEPWD